MLYRIRRILFGTILVLAVLAIAIMVFSSQSYVAGRMDAEYTIHLSEKLKDHDYVLRYENQGKTLETYAEICRLKPGTHYKGFIQQNMAPAEADGIGVYNAKGRRIGKIELEPSFKPELGKKQYSFGALSDVHIGAETSEDDFRRALTYLVWTENVDFIVVNGDLTHKCTDEQLESYRKIAEEYTDSVPVYSIPGNHDTPSTRNADVMGILEDYTGQPMYYQFERGNDQFIFVGNYLSETNELFTRAELQWLYETLEASKDKRCFVFQHVRPDETSGNALGIYAYDIWGGTDRKVFEGLMKHYPNILLFHGHSHLEFALQNYDKKANYDGSEGYHSIHIPSVTEPRTGNKEGASSKKSLFGESQGYVVDVYENGVVLKGRDFERKRFLPIAQYFIETPFRAVSAEQYEDDTCTIHTDSSGVRLEWTNQLKIDKETGAEEHSGAYSVSQMLPISEDKEYLLCSKDIRSIGARICYYDEQGKYLGYNTAWESYVEEEAMPASAVIEPLENASSMRVRIWHGDNWSDADRNRMLSYLSLTQKDTEER